MCSSMATFSVLCLLVLTAVHLSVSQLTDEEKQDLLDMHNRARSMVDPIATNMEEMKWNDELAGVAQAHSTKCTTLTNAERNSQATTFSSVGENLGTSSPPSSVSLSSVFGVWFKEHLLYNYTTGECIIKGLCESYKQLVWAQSSQLGCGATRCSSIEGSSITGSGVVLVCNYGPAGNLEEQSPYMTGTSSCSNCPDDKRSCVKSLCSNNDDCKADKVTIDDVSVDKDTVTAKFSSDPNARFRCRLNDQLFKECKSPVIYSGLSPGRYCLTVQAACPNQSYQKGPKNSKKIRFMVSIKP